MDKHSSECQLLKITEIAERWQVSTRTVEREIAAGRLNPIRVGGQRRFSLGQIKAYFFAVVFFAAGFRAVFLLDDLLAGLMTIGT